MKRIWIKLLEPYGGHAKDALIEVEEPIGRAYIAAGKAVEETKVTPALEEVAAAEMRSALEALQNTYTQVLQEASAALRSQTEQFRKAIGFKPGHIEATESEDDKFIRSNGGFRNLGHFGHAVMGAHRPQNPEPRSSEMIVKWNSTLVRVNEATRALGTADGMFETSDADGGVLVPPDFSGRIWQRVYTQDNLLGRTDNYPITGNTLNLPRTSETSRVDGSRWGGTQGYWEGEAQQYTKSRPTFADLQLRLKKLTVLTYVTNELMTDAGIALDQYLMRSAGDEIVFKIINAMINGTGAGVPLGLLSDPARVTIAKETGQATKTIVYNNILNMYNRLWAPCRGKTIWLINQEIEPQLDLMALPVGTGGVPVYMRAGEGNSQFGGAEGIRFAMLKGRPVMPFEQCPGLGLEGDIILVDFSQVVSIVKGAIQSSMSIHLKFDYDETVFKWMFRMDSQGAWIAPLTPYKTNLAATYSFCTTLAAR